MWKMLPCVLELESGIDGDSGLGALGRGNDRQLHVFGRIACHEQPRDIGAFELSGADRALPGERAAQVRGEITALALAGVEENAPARHNGAVGEDDLINRLAALYAGEFLAVDRNAEA